MRIYEALIGKDDSGKSSTQTYLSKEAPALVGFTCGNHRIGGCLTLDDHVRIHSCEKGMPCQVMKDKPIVWFKPIVAHVKNQADRLEFGIGGGGEDLNKEAVLLALDDEGVASLVEL